MEKSFEQKPFNKDERGLDKEDVDDLKDKFPFLQEESESLFFEWETEDGEKRASYFMKTESFPSNEGDESIEEAIKNKKQEVQQKGGTVLYTED